VLQKPKNRQFQWLFLINAIRYNQENYNFTLDEKKRLEIAFKDSIPSNAFIKIDDELIIMHEVNQSEEWLIYYNPD